jgi:glycosyltransferase involved in cell wall biosynthesis
MKILALIERPDHVCSRYRLEAFAWALAERDLYLEAVPLSKHLSVRAAQFLAARRADVVVLQRKLLPRWQLGLLRASARRLIYDLDDAVFQRDSFNPRGHWSPSRVARFAATVRAADAVMVGNRYLRHHAAAHTDPRRIHVVPTCITADWYSPAIHHRRGAMARLVWIGQRSTLESLRCAREHLATIASRLPGVQLRVVCDRAPDLAGVEVVPRLWSPATETAELADADIGVAWLPDDTWSLGKCGLKVLQFMAAGLPVVANPVGMNRAMVCHGKTGLLASTPTQWAKAVERLAADPALRTRMGREGRRVVEKHYSVETWGPRVAALIDSVARFDFSPAMPAIPGHHFSGVRNPNRGRPR